MHKIGKKAIRRASDRFPVQKLAKMRCQNRQLKKCKGLILALTLFENQKNSWSTMSWSAVQKSKNAM